LYLQGIKALDNEHGFWHKLIHQLRIPRKIDTTTISFGIAGFFNCGKRMGNAKLVTDMMTTSNYTVMSKKMDQLLLVNKERKALQARLFKFAVNQTKTYLKRYDKTMIAIIPEGQGVAGIIASMLLSKYKRPTFVFTRKGDNLSGSGRSLGGINLLEVFEHFKDRGYWLVGGGHKGAAGCEERSEDILKFAESFETVASGLDIDLEPKYNLEVPLTLINHDFYELIYSLDPYSLGFRPPVFFTTITIDSIFLIGADKSHAVVKTTVDGNKKELIFFDSSTTVKGINKGDTVDIIYSISKRLNFNAETIGMTIEHMGKR